MVPSPNLHPSASHASFSFGYNIYSENFGLMNRFEGYNHDYTTAESCKGSDPHPLVPSLMVEDESRSNSLNETGSSSKDVQDGGDKGWLRLGLSIGGSAMDSHTHIHNKHDRQPQPQPDPIARRGFGLTELDLLPATSKLQLQNDCLAPRAVSNFSTTPLVLPQPPEVNWAFRPISHNIGIANPSSCSSFIPFGSYFSTPLQLQTCGLDLVAAGPSSDTIRVIDPPRRHHSGIWFTLQPLENQGKHPVLPRRSLSSSYLRIKDGRMTVGLVIKYLVNKLRLDSESEKEIEIRCRGEKLEPCLTMQHIRDNVWRFSSSLTSLLPHSSSSPSTIDHIMVLHYTATATSTSPSPPHSN